MEKLDPNAKKVFFVRQFFTSLFLLVAITAVGVFFYRELRVLLDEPFSIGKSMIFVLFATDAALASIGSWIGSVLIWRSYSYALDKDSFQQEFGIVKKRYVSILYRRIQNVNIERSLLERLTGVSTVSIQTAGSGMAGPESTVPGLSPETAEALRDALLKKSKVVLN